MSREILATRVDPVTHQLVFLVAGQDEGILSPREFLVWAAAWIDTEGTVGYYRYRDKRPGHSFRYSATVSIANNHPAPAQLFKTHFGATAFTRSARSSSAFSKRPMYGWIANSRKAVQVLEQVVPFLLVKKEQALLIIEHYKQFHRSRNGHGYPENPIPLHERLWRRIRELNRGTIQSKLYSSSVKEELGD